MNEFNKSEIFEGAGSMRKMLIDFSKKHNCTDDESYRAIKLYLYAKLNSDLNENLSDIADKLADLNLSVNSIDDTLLKFGKTIDSM